MTTSVVRTAVVSVVCANHDRPEYVGEASRPEATVKPWSSRRRRGRVVDRGQPPRMVRLVDDDGAVRLDDEHENGGVAQLVERVGKCGERASGRFDAGGLGLAVVIQMRREVGLPREPGKRAVAERARAARVACGARDVHAGRDARVRLRYRGREAHRERHDVRLSATAPAKTARGAGAANAPSATRSARAAASASPTSAASATGTKRTSSACDIVSASRRTPSIDSVRSSPRLMGRLK